MWCTVGRVSIVIIIIIILSIHSILTALLPSNTLYIVVTLPYIYDDVKSLVCPEDVVISLIKPGVDPHEYQLTPDDVNIVKRASIIISTAHTHFELKIRELIEIGELNATLIEIPYLDNIKILKNPSTNMENYHEILFYPENYIAFIDYLKNIMASLNPQCSKNYEENAHQLILRLKKISNISFKPNKMAVLDLPIIQYIATWLGFNISHILISEEEVPVTPEDVEKAEKILERYNNSIVIVTNGSKASYYLIELANKYGRESIILPNPLLSSSIVSTLEDVISYLNTSRIERRDTNTYIQLQSDIYVVTSIIAVITATVILLLSFKLKRR